MGLDTVRTAGEIAIRVTKHLGFEPELCLRQISPRSACDNCERVCPVDAIKITRSTRAGQMADMHLDEDACIECGLCTLVCPTGAFTWANPSLMQLRSKIAKLAQAGIGDIYITCDKTGAAELGASFVSVPCLGMLPWEFWLSIQSDYDNVSVFLPDGLCSECEITGGEDSLVEQISLAEEISGKGFDLVDRKRDLKLKDIREELGYDPSRRGFFTGFADTGKRVAGMAFETVMGTEFEERPRDAVERFKDQRVKMQQVMGEEISEEDKHRAAISVGSTAVLTVRRHLLLETLKRHPELAPSTPVIVPSVSSLCTDCKACAYLCPTEAITIGPNGIMMNAQYCVSCRLCNEICWPGAIQFEERNALIFASDGPYDLKQEGVKGTYTISGDHQDVAKMGDMKSRPSLRDSLFETMEEKVHDGRLETEEGVTADKVKRSTYEKLPGENTIPEVEVAASTDAEESSSQDKEA